MVQHSICLAFQVLRIPAYFRLAFGPFGIPPPTHLIDLPVLQGGVCWCERLGDGWGTMATTRVPRLQIGERPWEWTRG